MPAREQKVPGPDHPITVTASGTHVVVRAGDTVVADTTAALTLQEADYPPAYYLPLADVDRSLLQPSDTTTYCPYKGEASYFSIKTGADEITDAIWYYSDPYLPVAEIREHVAFYTSKVEQTVG